MLHILKFTVSILVRPEAVPGFACVNEVPLPHLSASDQFQDPQGRPNLEEVPNSHCAVFPVHT